jgi:ADP-heptose:LPS heptosyltransferase
MGGGPIDKASIRRIAIVKLCCLGDVAFTTPLARALKKGLPHAEITYVSGRYSLPVAQRVPQADHVVELPEGSLGRALGLVASRRRRFDLAFVLHKTAGAQLGAWLMGARYRLGFDFKGQGFSLTHPLPFDPGLHEVRRNLSLLGPLGLLPDGEETGLQLLPGDAEAGQALVARAGLDLQRPIAGIFPAGGKNPGTVLLAKRWTPEGYRSLAQWLLAHGWQVAVFSAPDAPGLAESITQGLGAGAGVVGHGPLGPMLGAIAQCRYFVGGDTGPTHFAAALGLPTLTLFGPTEPSQWAPLGERHEQVWRHLPCSPCFTPVEKISQRFLDCKDWACLRQMGAAEVIAHAEAQLDRLQLRAA